MRLSLAATLMILTTIFLSACSQDQTASVEDHGSEYHGRNGVQTVAMAAPVMGVSSSSNFSSHVAVNTGGTPFQHGQSAYANHVSVDTSPKPAYSAPVMQNKPILPQTSAAAPAAPLPKLASANRWQWPVEGKVTEKFGTQANGIANEGITIAAADGTPIKAAGAGEVAYVGTNVRDYGNMVILRHADGTLTSYAHAREILVAKGDHVQQGDVLGYVGQSGSVNSPQLHFAMRQGSTVVDPLSRLPQQVAAN